MSLLLDMAVILGLSLGVIYIFHRLGLPAIVGFLVTGALAGPHGLGLVANPHEVELMAEVGVVLLLFTIGLEFSIGELMRIKGTVLAGGFLQVGGAVALSWLVAWWGQAPWNVALFLGFQVALSSTAIVLNLLQERSNMDSPAGRLCLAILIFQDLAVVPMMLSVPLLSGDGAGAMAWQPMLLKGLAAIAALVVGGRWVAPWVLARVASTRSREMFLLTVVGLCLGVALLTWWAGLSMALGAFAAGLIISSSPFALQAIGSVQPMRDLFTSLFFVSIGMLIEPGYLWENPWLVLTATGVVLVVKIITASGAVLLLGYGLRVAGATGLALSQVGEFSFVLAQIGQSAGLIGHNEYNLFLATAILTMVVTPFLLSAGFGLDNKAPQWLSSLGLGWFWSRSWRGEEAAKEPAPDVQVVVVGYGLAGRNVVRAAQLAGIPYLVMDMNPHTVRRQAAEGLNITYGDATNPAVLEHLGLGRARVLVISMGGSLAARRITAAAKSVNPSLHVIARTRYDSEAQMLKEIGADEVIPEEYETALEIFTRVLRRLLIPESDIAPLLAQLRRSDYNSLRGVSVGNGGDSRLSGLFDDTEIATYRLDAASPLAGVSLGQAALRKEKGVTVVAIRRAGGAIASPGADETLLAGDLVVVMGEPQNVAAAARLFGCLTTDQPTPASA